MKQTFTDLNTGKFRIRTVGKLLAAILVGLSIGTLFPPEPVVLPVVGSVSGIIVGGTGLLVGVALFTRIPGCGCSSDCDR